ncbi:KRBA2 (predicted) [Pycnogonum litorale]
MLVAWMGDNDTNDWSVGIKFVQFQKNSSFHCGIQRSPYAAMFGCEAKVGLTSSSLPTGVVERMQSEDDLVSALSNLPTIPEQLQEPGSSANQEPGLSASQEPGPSTSQEPGLSASQEPGPSTSQDQAPTRTKHQSGTRTKHQSGNRIKRQSGTRIKRQLYFKPRQLTRCG